MTVILTWGRKNFHPFVCGYAWYHSKKNYFIKILYYRLFIIYSPLLNIYIAWLRRGKLIWGRTIFYVLLLLFQDNSGWSWLLQFDQIYVHILFFDCYYFTSFMSVIGYSCWKEMIQMAKWKFNIKCIDSYVS